MIIVNGEEFEIDSGSSVAKLVEERGLDRSRVAVELNGEIVPRGTFDDTLLHDGDKVEIVHFSGRRLMTRACCGRLRRLFHGRLTSPP